MKKTLLLVGIVFLAVNFVFAGSAEWWRFNGPNGDNISLDKGLLKSWPAEGPKLIWKYTDCGVGFSGVSIADGMIFTTGDRDGNCIIIALDSKTGKLKWEKENGKKYDNRAGTRSTPTYSDGTIYHLNAYGNIVALNAKDGKEVWAVNAAKEFGAPMPSWAFSESVLVDGNNVIFYIGGKNGSLIALDKKTGKTVWADKEFDDKPSYCSTIIAEINGVRQYIAMSAKYVAGYDTKNGSLLWSFPYKTNYDVHATSPVYKDNYIYVSSGYGVGGVCIKLTKEGSKFKAEEVWSNKSLDNHHGGVILYNGYIYGSGGKSLICLDLKTGEEKYNEKKVGKGSITFADGMLYCYNESSGQVALLKADPDSPSIVSKFMMEKGGKSSFWAHPVVCDGRLYVRHDNNLCVYDVKGK